MNKANESSTFEKFFGKIPHFRSNIRVFNEMGIVQIYNKQIKAKLDNQGITCMFVGYSKDHKSNVYCMLNIVTLKSKNTRDVIWLNKSYGE